jgi:hypothetical protein
MKSTVLVLTVLIGMMVFAGAAQACVNMDPEEQEFEDGPVPLEDANKLSRCSPVVDDPLPEELGPVMVTAFVIVIISLVAFMKKFS